MADGVFDKQFWIEIKDFVVAAGVEPLTLGETQNRIWAKILQAMIASGLPVSGGSSRRELLRLLYAALPTGGGPVVLPRLPLDARIVYLGDSNTEFGNGNGAGYALNDQRGYSAWINAGLGSKFFVPAVATTDVVPNRGGNLGKAGENAAEITARIASAIALSPAVIVLLSGTNTLFDASKTAANIFASWKICHDAARAAGIRIVQTTIPIGSGTAAWTPAQDAVRIAANNMLKAAASPWLLVLDSDLVLTNSSQFANNEVHYSNLGAHDLGFAAAQKMLDAAWIALESPATLWAGANLLTVNADLTGNVSGRPTGYSLFTGSGGGATLVSTKDTDDKPILTIGGAKTGNGRSLQMYEESTAVPAVGDVIEAYIDFEITEALVNVAGVQVQASILDAARATILQTSSAAINRQDAFPLGVGRYQFRGPPTIMPAGSPVYTRTYFHSALLDGSLSVSGKVKVHKMGVRKVV